MRIRDIFSKPISRNVEEIIKFDQTDQSAVKEEIEEYIITEAIEENFVRVLDNIVEVARDPREGIGIWVSGFFGSGKSLFSKVLGYVLSNKPLLDTQASRVFKASANSSSINSLLDIINNGLPMRAVIFDLSHERGHLPENEKIAYLMYKALLQELDYSTDLDLAELEIDLEAQGRLEAFSSAFQEKHDLNWKERRNTHFGIIEASSVLHGLWPETYSSEESFLELIKAKSVDVNAKLLVRRSFDLAEMRCPGTALIFIIDEVGQFVSRSVDKMLDLQGVVEEFGIEGKNRAKSKSVKSPFWVVVTSQEKLNEIVSAIASKKVELARLQDRFRIPVDLKQSDISEIAAKRLLEKTDEAREKIRGLFDEYQGRIKRCCSLERSQRTRNLEKTDFVSLYPYLPYQIDLCIDIVGGLRLRRSNVLRHVGGSNRTIIKQTQQMIINKATNLGDKELGALVSLDKIYDLLYSSNLIPSEVTREVDSVPKLIPEERLAFKIAKAIALLENVKDIPRTVNNLAAVLHPSVDADSLREDVEKAIAKLAKAQVIKDSEHGFKLLSLSEKNWDKERRELHPRSAQENRIKREVLGDIFSDTTLRNVRYGTLKNFRVTARLEGENLDSEGDIVFNITAADTSELYNERKREARQLSQDKRDVIQWVVEFDERLFSQIAEVFRSQEMTARYERRSFEKLSEEDRSCLNEEKIRKDRHIGVLRKMLRESLASGTLYFGSVEYDCSGLGKNTQEVIQKAVQIVVPSLYPKLEMGAVQVDGSAALEFLTAANLDGLPSRYFGGLEGLGIIEKREGKSVPAISSATCTEVLTFILGQHKYGNRVTGKLLESKFTGRGYGWNRELIKLLLAVLFRAGAVEITYQGKRFVDFSSKVAQQVFAK